MASEEIVSTMDPLQRIIPFSERHFKSWSSGTKSSPVRTLLQYLVLIVVVAYTVDFSDAQTLEPKADNGSESLYELDACGANTTKENLRSLCKQGLVLPVWCPAQRLSFGDRFSRGLIYFLGLAYMFVGVSIVADKFMSAIEVITSQEKELVIKRANGETQTVVVRIWNETVANLTLMALGSSAPEILLSIIEIYGTGFKAGELGPGTIVGSAAFNLFVIIGLCIWVVPSTEVRKVKHLRVFFVTATWSVFAYIWLYAILSWFSYGVIEVWEAVLTFLFFPLTVLTAYVADRRMLIYKYLAKSYRINKRGAIVEGEGDLELGAKANHVDGGFKHFEEEENDEVREFEENRREYIKILKELRMKNPDCEMEELQQMARDEILNRGPKSRAFYRIQATRKLMGQGNIMKKKIDTKEDEQGEEKQEAPQDNIQRIFFDPGHYTVMENVGEFAVTVTREGGDLNRTVYVDYKTEDGTASAGSDYTYAEGTLVFGPGETHKQFTLSVLDDDVFEEDEHFYIRLSNIRIAGVDGKIWPVAANGGSPGSPDSPSKAPVQLVTPSLATVMILDDDHGGIFNFADRETEVPECIGQMDVKIHRFSGARGRVSIPYRTIDGTAHAGKDYDETEGDLIFENNETEKAIQISIIPEDSYEKDVIFFVELGEPKHILKSGAEDDALIRKEGELTEEEKIALLGRPKLGELIKTQVRIKESKEFKNTVDKLIKMANVSLMVGTSSWKEQFIEAITVQAGDGDGDDEDEEGEGKGEGEEKLPSCSDYIMHFITIFWKVLFAFVPPTDYWNGWLCFIVSILGIGLLTALIGDLASHFGCTVGLKDTVTAVSFVALGTSVPDTFASKVAAINDKYADASVGNVTGSNAVNVFLGIGIAWSMAAIYHAFKGEPFLVDPGNLAFAVTLFCTLALCAIMLLMYRRKKVGGELGGRMSMKVPTALCFFGFWVFYIAMSSMEAYDIINF